MSDLLIKGMEMPQNCEKCDLKVWDEYDDVDYVCPFSGVIVLNIGRQGSCPLVEVPPHGRLIDADALVKEVEDIAKELPSDSIGAERFKLFAEFITEMPTIIPASEEGET